MTRTLAILMIIAAVLALSWQVVAQTTGAREQLQLEREALLQRLTELDRELGITPEATPPATVASAREPAAPDTGEPAPAKWPIASIIAIAALAGVILIGIAYQFLIAPIRKRKPLIAAIRIIDGNDIAQFAKAEELLREAITAGMRRRDVADANFSLAYVRARLERYDDAAAVLPDLKRVGGAGPADIYLGLWINSHLKRHEEVERSYLAHADELSDMLDTKLIAAIAFLAKARQQWRQKRIQGARHYYDQMRELGMLTEQIPEGIDEHQVLLGVESLFDGNIADAHRQFSDALESAEQAAAPGVAAKLGLLLCKWMEARGGNIEEALGEVVDAMKINAASDGPFIETACTHCATKFTVKESYESQRVVCLDCKRRFIVAAIAEQAEAEEQDSESENDGADSGELKSAETDERCNQLLTDDDLLKRNALLWRMVVYLYTWLDLAKGTTLKSSQIDTLRRHGEAVGRISPDMPDPVLLFSLIDYYFADSDERRDEAIGRLREADVSVPEVISLVDRHTKAEAERRNLVNRYFEMLERYFNSTSASQQVRNIVKQNLLKFSRFRDWFDEIELDKAPSELDPISGMESEGKLIARRLKGIATLALSETDEEAREQYSVLIRELEERAKRLQKDAKSVEEAQMKAILEMGPHLLRDEEPVDEKPDSDKPDSDEPDDKEPGYQAIKYTDGDD